MYRSVDLAFISYENFKVQRDFQREKANLTSDWNTTTLHYIYQARFHSRLIRRGWPTSSPRRFRNKMGTLGTTRTPGPGLKLTSTPDQTPSMSPRRYPQDKSGTIWYLKLQHRIGNIKFLRVGFHVQIVWTGRDSAPWKPGSLDLRLFLSIDRHWL